MGGYLNLWLTSEWFGRIITRRLANQEVLRWILSMKDAVGEHASHDQIKDYLWSTLKSGRVIPGCAEL